jgi:glycine cleavage system H protein
MNPYTYHNIFETKGIEYLVVIGFLLLIIPFWSWLNKPVKMKSEAGQLLGSLTPQVLRVPKGLLYSLNHTWAHLSKAGLATVGMDDLLLHLTGGVEVQFLKDQHEKVGRGEPVAELRQDGKRMLVTSPISGTLVQNHNSLSEEPQSLLEDPYRAWLLKIEPDRWQQETADLLMGEEAVRWNSEELERFRDFMAETSGLSGADSQVVYQAGGEIIDHPLSGFDQKVWDRFQEIFLGLGS